MKPVHRPKIFLALLLMASPKFVMAGIPMQTTVPIKPGSFDLINSNGMVTKFLVSNQKTQFLYPTAKKNVVRDGKVVSAIYTVHHVYRTPTGKMMKSDEAFTIYGNAFAAIIDSFPNRPDLLSQEQGRNVVRQATRVVQAPSVLDPPPRNCEGAFAPWYTEDCKNTCASRKYFEKLRAAWNSPRQGACRNIETYCEENCSPYRGLNTNERRARFRETVDDVVPSTSLGKANPKMSDIIFCITAARENTAFQPSMAISTVCKGSQTTDFGMGQVKQEVFYDTFSLNPPKVPVCGDIPVKDLTADKCGYMGRSRLDIYPPEYHNLTANQLYDRYAWDVRLQIYAMLAVYKNNSLGLKKPVDTTTSLGNYHQGQGGPKDKKTKYAADVMACARGES